MIFYQKDFLSDKIYIEPQSVHLFLSSLPLSVFDENLALLFGRLNQLMCVDGYILLDVPAGYNERLVRFYHIGQAMGWQCSSWCHLIPDAYEKGKTQAINIFQRYNNGWKPQYEKKRTLQVTSTDRTHKCEFDKEIVCTLIQFYSKKGDIVLDGFCGTGRVPGEAEKLGRIGIGVDIRPFSNIRVEYK